MRSETQTSIPYEVLGCLKSLTIKTQKITCSLRKKLEKKILYRCLVENLYGLRHLKDSNKCQQLNERTIPVQEPSIKVRYLNILRESFCFRETNGVVHSGFCTTVTYIPFFHPKIDRGVEWYTDSTNLRSFAQFLEHIFDWLPLLVANVKISKTQILLTFFFCFLVELGISRKKLSIDWSSVQSYEIGKTSMSERGKVGMRCSSFVNYNHNSFLDSDGFPFVEGLDEIEFQSLGGSS